MGTGRTGMRISGGNEVKGIAWNEVSPTERGVTVEEEEENVMRIEEMDVGGAVRATATRADIVPQKSRWKMFRGRERHDEEI
jgi:hypothetical protein